MKTETDNLNFLLIKYNKYGMDKDRKDCLLIAGFHQSKQVKQIKLNNVYEEVPAN